MNSNFWFNLEPMPGCNIYNCAKEAIRIAELLGVTVSFKFNGVDCGARAGDDPDLLVENYHYAMESKSSIKVAYANPIPVEVK